jgi:UDP-N-acetylglucosamine--N-acetylmuramyl-(pentapeptide) pyrophosphoryl-undecaprenol N-acetylglucosamine transferase
VLFSTYLDGLEFAKANRLNVVSSPPISYQVRDDGSIDLRTTSARIGFSLGVNRFLHQLIGEIQNIERFSPNVVLIDSRLSSLIAARLLGKPIAVILNQYRIHLLYNRTYPRRSLMDRLFVLIARLGWTFLGVLIGELWCLGNVIIIPDFPPPLTISKHNLVIPARHHHKLRFVGPLIEQSLRTEIPREDFGRQLGFHDKKPFIYAAISGPKHEREPLNRILVPLLISIGNEFNVVVSCGNPLGSTKPELKGKVLQYEWANEQDRLIATSDIIVSRAGHTTIVKSMLSGRPMLLIPTPFQTEQLANANTAKSLGFAEVLQQRDLSRAALEDAINLLLEQKSYARAARRIMKETRRFDGVAECYAITSSLAAERLRGGK